MVCVFIIPCTTSLPSAVLLILVPGRLAEQTYTPECCRDTSEMMRLPVPNTWMPSTPMERPSETHTHTHTHVGFYGLRGLSIGVMVFILYKLYVLLPYTYPTPKLGPHRRRCISIFPQKNSLCMIYKRFKLWGH